MEITFLNPIYLWFLIAVPILILLHFVGFRYARMRAMKFANFEAVNRVIGGQLLRKNIILLIIRSATLILIILSLSGMVLWYSGERSDFDVVLAIDSSGSMLTDDYKPNRLEAAKAAAILFVNSTKSEIGIVSFSGVGFVEQTMTDDSARVREAINNIKVRPATGTAIGDAIITSSNLLAGTERPKIIILLTDGQSNVGIALEDAIDYANENHITIYTIGIGTELEEVLPLDEKILKEIAEKTNGNYYKAGNATMLSSIYRNLASSSEQKIPIYLSLPLLLIALFLLIVEWGLQNTKFRVIPG